jgi:hypothetical protein
MAVSLAKRWEGGILPEKWPEFCLRLGKPLQNQGKECCLENNLAFPTAYTVTIGGFPLFICHF